MNLGLLLSRQAERNNNKLAVQFEGLQLSYGQLNARVNQLAAALRGFGIQKGDRVAVLLHNCHQYVEIFWATAKIGAIMVPINWRLAPPEVQYILDDSAARVLIYGSSFSETVVQIAQDLQSVKRFVIVDGNDELGTEYEQWIDGKSTAEPSSDGVELDDLAVIMYTSGTTGRPKGVMLTHNNIIWTSINQIVDFQIVPEDKTLIIAPMFHVGGLFIFSLPAIHVGAMMVIHRKFDVEATLRALNEEKITILFGAPTMFHMIVQQEDLVKKYRYEALRFVISGGASLPMPTMRKMIELFPGAQFTEGYGITETASCSSFLRFEDVLRKSGSVGKPFLHNEMKVVDDDGNPVKPGQIGEVVLAGPTVMKGYWNNPEATREAFRGKWFRTGDLAIIDEEGFFYIIDRKKDMIISGAENIYPKEIENVLYEHPKILEAAVIGVPDEKWGESVLALIVPQPGESLDEAEVMEYCKGRIASYKKPKYIKFVPELPKNPSGKILKHVLRKQYSVEFKEAER